MNKKTLRSIYNHLEMKDTSKGFLRKIHFTNEFWQAMTNNIEKSEYKSLLYQNVGIINYRDTKAMYEWVINPMTGYKCSGVWIKIRPLMYLLKINSEE